MRTFSIYSSETVSAFRSYLQESNFKQIKTNQKITYYNVASCYDIETSSFYENFIVAPANKRAIMYAWVLGIKDFIIIGRTWDEFITLCENISEELCLCDKRRLILYVHNLSFDFQFFRKHFTFKKVFALEERDLITALTDNGIEFRCSYKLSGYSLAKVGEHLLHHDVKKKVGDLDYSKIRTPLTPLTEKEYGYIEYDARVVIAYIEEEMETAGDITKIPLTKTGKVRNYCRQRCLHTYKSHKKHDDRYTNYRRIMNKLTINSVLEYDILHLAFMGGFTHGNHFHTGQVMKNVSSFDFTSSYPAVMVLEQYPMYKGELITLKSTQEFYENIKLYCCVFTATFYDIEETFIYDHYISVSKCIEKEGIVNDNGRVVKAKKITMCITEVDFEIIKETYKWSKLTIKNFRRYKRGYLPRDFILSILDLYEKKTVLKGDEEHIAEYQQSKENINSCYGMTVTNICRPEIVYQTRSKDSDIEFEEWSKETPDYVKVLEKYNKDKRRFLFYAWGIYVTAYARRNLWNAILQLKEDYLYSDTDSVKLTNLDKHKDFFRKYNEFIYKGYKRVLEWQKIDINKIIPKTQDGVTKLLGAWDYEGTYDRFKYLGAKRYMVEKDGKLSLTVSGLNKKTTIPYLIKTYKTNDRIFEEFKEGLLIPKGATGKQIHTYIDYETEGLVRDYLGYEYHYNELSGIHLEEAEYLLDLNAEYLAYLLGKETIIN